MLKKYLEAGKFVTTHGVLGELKAYPYCDSAEFLCGFSLLYPAANGGRPWRVASARAHKGMELLKFKEYDNINDVQTFRDCYLAVPEEAQGELAEGEYYYHQIIGLVVETTAGQALGTIKEILAPGANDVWVVQRPGQKDLLLPVIDDVVKDVDLAAGVVTVELMEGLE